MAYTKTGPFTNNAAPAVTATFLNNVETALAVATPTTASGLSITSGATFTITVPSFSGGLLTVHGTAGGAWSSIWVGTYIADAARVDLTQLGTDFTTPGQLITSVTGSSSSLVVTVATASSGSTAVFDWTMLRSGGGG